MRKVGCFVLALSITASAAQAGSIGRRGYDTPVALADRNQQLVSSDGGMVATGKWVPEGFRIAWDITPSSNGFLYNYTLTGLNNAEMKPGISHFLIELSANVTAADIINSTLNGSALTNSMSVKTHAPNPGSPNQPASIHGLKVDDGDGRVSFSFEINRMPVWGNFYAKGGGGPQLSEAFNSGFVSGLSTGDMGYFIARPDSMPSSVTIIPLPPAFMAGLALLGAAGGLSRRR